MANKKRIFTWLTLLAATVCLAAFAWADSKKINDKTIMVDASADLRSAVADAASGDTIIISKDAKIDMGATSLSIPETRNVTILLSEGSSLDFSNVTEKLTIDGDDYKTCIYNLGHLTIAGSGDLVMSNNDEHAILILCSGNNVSLNVTGGSFALNCSCPLTGQNYAIYNNGSSADITVTGGSFTVSGDTDGNDSTSENCAIYNDGDGANITVTGGSFTASNIHIGTTAICNGGDGADITVTGGKFTASGGEENNYAICNEGDGASITVTDGSFTVSGSGTYTCAIFNGGNSADITVTGGSFTVGGGGWGYEYKCAIYNYSSGASITVTGGSFTVSSDINNYAIFNDLGDGMITVMGGSFTVSGGCDTPNYAICNQDSDASIMVKGGSFKASGGSDNYAIYNIVDSASVATVTVWSGNFVGDLGSLGKLNKSLHGGTYTNCDNSFVEVMVADGCAYKKTGNVYVVYNQAVLSCDHASPVVGKGQTKTVSFEFLSLDETPLSLDLDGVSIASKDLPESLSVAVTDINCNNGTFNLVISNDGCESTDVYPITVTASNDKSYEASAVLNILVLPQGDSSSSSGCNAGFAALALIGLAFVPFKIKK